MNYEALLTILLIITSALLVLSAYQENLRAFIGCAVVALLIPILLTHESAKNREKYYSEIKKQMVKIIVEKGELQQKFLTCLELDMPLETCIYKTIKKEEK